MLEAKQRRLILEVAPLVDELQNQAGFFVHPHLQRQVLMEAGEGS